MDGEVRRERSIDRGLAYRDMEFAGRNPSVAQRLSAGREPNRIGALSMITPQLCTLSKQIDNKQAVFRDSSAA